MAETSAPGKSRYARKVDLQASGRYRVPRGMNRPRRRCTGCGGPLWGRKSHGFPGANGHGVFCGGCKRP